MACEAYKKKGQSKVDKTARANGLEPLHIHLQRSDTLPPGIRGVVNCLLQRWYPIFAIVNRDEYYTLPPGEHFRSAIIYEGVYRPGYPPKPLNPDGDYRRINAFIEREAKTHLPSSTSAIISTSPPPSATASSLGGSIPGPSGRSGGTKYRIIPRKSSKRT